MMSDEGTVPSSQSRGRGAGVVGLAGVVQRWPVPWGHSALEKINTVGPAGKIIRSSVASPTDIQLRGGHVGERSVAGTLAGAKLFDAGKPFAPAIGAA